MTRSWRAGGLFQARHAKSGNPIDVRAADFFTVRNGRLAELRRFLDFESLDKFGGPPPEHYRSMKPGPASLAPGPASLESEHEGTLAQGPEEQGLLALQLLQAPGERQRAVTGSGSAAISAGSRGLTVDQAVLHKPQRDISMRQKRRRRVTG
jgi:hypothetical protein